MMGNYKFKLMIIMLVMILTMILKINDHYNNFFVAYIDKNYNNDNYVNDNITDDNDRIIMMQLINTLMAVMTKLVMPKITPRKVAKTRRA